MEAHAVEQRLHVGAGGVVEVVEEDEALGGEYGRVAERVRVFVDAVQVDPEHVGAVVAVEDPVGVEHRNEFEDESVCGWSRWLSGATWWQLERGRLFLY